jgi:hypothetical protein
MCGISDFYGQRNFADLPGIWRVLMVRASQD